MWHACHGLRRRAQHGPASSASIFGHDTVIFLDDDEVVTSPDFLERAVYGIACQTPTAVRSSRQRPATSSTARDSPLADREGARGTTASGTRRHGFNEYISKASSSGPRLCSRERPHAAVAWCLHADAYGRVAFDPWIARGEDTRLRVVNAHMYGGRCVARQPAERPASAARRTPLPAGRFEQDVYRWFYENRKIEFAKTQIDLMQVMPASLNPYPGPWLDARPFNRRARLTAYLRVIGRAERGEYLAHRQQDYAQGGRCVRARELRQLLRVPAPVAQHRALRYGTTRRSPSQLVGARNIQSAAASFTGRFTAINVEQSDSKRTRRRRLYGCTKKSLLAIRCSSVLAASSFACDDRHGHRQLRRASRPGRAPLSAIIVVFVHHHRWWACRSVGDLGPRERAADPTSILELVERDAARS